VLRLALYALVSAAALFFLGAAAWEFATDPGGDWDFNPDVGAVFLAIGIPLAIVSAALWADWATRSSRDSSGWREEG
jgi:hypothetical protein